MRRILSALGLSRHEENPAPVNGQPDDWRMDVPPVAQGRHHAGNRSRPKTKRRRAARRQAGQLGHVDERLVAFHKNDAAIAEQYHKLYIEIVRRGQVRELRTLLITSALQEEGKTHTALNLAATMAMSGGGQNVLLVETNFRKPSIHHRLDTSPECGLTDYLLGDVDFEKIFAQTPIPGLAVVYAGRRVHNPLSLVRSDNLRQFFNQVKAQPYYDYIVLDSSPILLTTEPAALIAYVDAALMVVQAGKTPQDMVTQAIETLGSEHVLGCVFNGMTASDYHGYHRYYRSSYYHPDASPPPSA